MKFFRSLCLLVGLAALPACATSGLPNEAQSREPAPMVQAAVPTQKPALTMPRVAPPAAGRSFVVHFDFDSADIRASAMQILYEVSQVAGKAKPAAIRIHGFTDASGKRAYNQRLSERRAQAVADQLSKLGIKVATVETKGFGESNPAIKAKGKFKDNRRVEIVFEGGDEAAAVDATVEPAKTTAKADIIAPPQGPAPALLTATAGFSSPVPLQTTGKHAIKRDRVQVGTAWIPPAPAATGSPGRMGGRAV